MWEVAGVQRALRTKILSLAIPEPQEIMPFPQILELQFTAHFLLLLNQKSQENSKTHKLKTKLSY